MFAFGDRKWPGLSKLAEECGEVVQVIGKLIQTRGETRHWNRPDLRRDLLDEIADVQAAVIFVLKHCHLDAKAFDDRVAKKLARFEKWHKEGGR